MYAANRAHESRSEKRARERKTPKMSAYARDLNGLWGIFFLALYRSNEGLLFLLEFTWPELRSDAGWCIS